MEKWPRNTQFEGEYLDENKLYKKYKNFNNAEKEKFWSDLLKEAKKKQKIKEKKIKRMTFLN